MADFIKCASCGKNLSVDVEKTLALCPACGSPFSASLQKDRRLGDYLIKERLGTGGMGEVFLAEQISMQRPVALKVLPSSLTNDKLYMERFFREVRMLAQIDHPGVVKAYEAGMDNGVCFFSMMLVSGKDIKKMIDAGRKFSEEEMLKTAIAVAEALKCVWRRHKIIHRDVKPANIIIDNENNVRLMDLGISRKESENTDLTTSGGMVGSPSYISPEQAKSEKTLDCRADIYSLGATCYHMLAGEAPFQGPNAMAVISMHLTETAPDITGKRPDISNRSAGMIKKMMAKKKEERFKDWDDFLDYAEESLALLKITSELRNESITQARKHILPSAIYAPLMKLGVKLKPRRKISRGRIAALAVLLVLFTMMLSAIVRKSVKEETFRKNSSICANALSLAENAPPAKFSEAISALDTALKLVPEYRETLLKAQENLKERIISYRKDQLVEKIQKDMLRLRSKSADFEKKSDFNSALALWNSYNGTGEFKNSEIFKKEYARACEYLKTKISNMEKGINE